MPGWLSNLLPLVLLLVAIAVVLKRLPKVDLGHSEAFLLRRRMNWLPVGLTYAFLYMARYNLTVFRDFGGLTKAEYGGIFGVGTAVYGLSFFINGPLTDYLGGRRTILIAAVGAIAANVGLGLAAFTLPKSSLLTAATLLYAVNMYFQSFGAVSIVKVNSSWFHVRERGTFGGIFGILISLGLYFAYDWNRLIAEWSSREMVFFISPAVLGLLAVIVFFVVRDEPAHAGHANFDVADASSGDTEKVSVVGVFLRMFRNPVIMIIAMVEFCSGYLRNGIVQWYTAFAKDIGASAGFVAKNWGLLTCVAGILGGMFAGVISDRLFSSRRGPVSAVLYGGSLVAIAGMWLFLSTPLLGWCALLVFLCIIGVHGMLSGTASMDFGGRKNAGIAVGIIDGFVYFGTSIGSFLLGWLLPADGDPARKDPANWWRWPVVMVPVAVLGLVLALKVWNARPKAHAAAAK